MLAEQSHMTSLFENATEGFVITDSAATIVLANPAACKMFGYQADEMTGQKIEILIPLHYREAHVQLRQGFYQHPQNRVMGHGRDLHGLHKDGHTFPVEVSLSTYVKDEERYAIAFIVDITRRKEIEQRVFQHQEQLEKITADMRRLNAELEAKVEERTVVLKEALQRLEQSQSELQSALEKEKQLNEIKGRFVSMASHEFRTPLSTILSSASLISRYQTDSEEEKRRRHTEKIKASVKHLNDLLNDFLSLGKLDEGKVTAQAEAIALPEVVQDTIEEMKGLAKKGQAIIYEHDDTTVVQSDGRFIKNILINLLSNAIKFSDEGATIRVKSGVQNGNVFMAVADEGIGIADDDQQYLFTSFFRGRNAVNIQGTGLGLHIVKRYLDLLGGTVHLSSSLGKGTTITITFPIK